MFRQGGMHNGRRLLKAETVKVMIAPRVKSTETGSYGYGWMIGADGSYSHTGSDGTMAWVDPARGITGMVLTQSPGGINPRSDFRVKVSDAITTSVSSRRR